MYRRVCGGQKRRTIYFEPIAVFVRTFVHSVRGGRCWLSAVRFFLFLFFSFRCVRSFLANRSFVSLRLYLRLRHHSDVVCIHVVVASAAAVAWLSVGGFFFSFDSHNELLFSSSFVRHCCGIFRTITEARFICQTIDHVARPNRTIFLSQTNDYFVVVVVVDEIRLRVFGQHNFFFIYLILRSFVGASHECIA